MRVVPFDVPGHKRGRGNPELTRLLGENCVSMDVNSMKPLDNLCHPVSVIREAEELAADAFGAAHAFLMVGGTTSRRAEHGALGGEGGREDHPAPQRPPQRHGRHGAVRRRPVYVNPECDDRLGIPLGMTVSEVERAIRENPDAKAVLVNNPTYYGICSDLQAIVKLAHATACSAWPTRPTAPTSTSARTCPSPPWRRGRTWPPCPCTSRAAA